MSTTAPRRFNPLRWFLALLITAALAYPLAIALHTLIDSVRGDGHLINSLSQNPKRYLLQAFLNNWLTSLPRALALSTLVLLPLSFISHLIFHRQIVPVLFLSLLALNPLMALLYQFDVAALLVVSLWLCAVVCLLNVIGGRFGEVR